MSNQLVQHHIELTVQPGQPAGPAIADITAEIANWLQTIEARDGVLTVFLRHTSASLTIQENASPAVRADLIDALNRLAPESSAYRHNDEGPDDMPSHIKAMLTSVSLTIPVFRHAMALGTWQGVFLIEHRKRLTPRAVVLSFIGSCGA